MPSNKKEYMREYRKKNVEKMRENSKKSYEKRKLEEGFKEKKIAYQKEYRKKYPNKWLIQHWKCRGMVDGDWEAVYEMYKKNLDHNHETGELRYVVCNPCNRHLIG